MFEDFKLEEKTTFCRNVQHACISKANILVLVSNRKKITVQHIQQGSEALDLRKYLKEEINISYNFCKGVKQIEHEGVKSTDSCFAVILDCELWCLIVGLAEE